MRRGGKVVSDFVPYTPENGKSRRNTTKQTLDPEIEKILSTLKSKLLEATEEVGYKRKYEDLKKEHEKLIKKFNRLKKIIDIEDEN